VSEQDDSVTQNPLVQADALWVWNDEASEFMKDEDFEKVLELVVQIIGGEFPEREKIAAICVRLEAYAIKFRMGYSAYMSYKKGTPEANMRKNHYKELYTGIDRLVDALKYLVKV
jgi:hypothetical protein